ncbi:hypothetical protein [Solicola sp. PLA-1-18]|uniref:hypothetical protein n=1 Tax=Solicola sp. PLA-1-18 TaxID=3380532 RepID=UPI003B7B322F
MSPGSPPFEQSLQECSARNEVRLRALRVLVEAEDVLDDLCWWLLDLYETPSTPPSARETSA